MKKVEGSLAHPGHAVVKLQGGNLEGKVRPWTMAQRAELKPILMRLLETLGSLDRPENKDLSLAAVFDAAEEEFMQLAEASVELPADVKWDELYWEDGPIIVQAVWETSLAREDGQGLMGKVMGVLGTALTSALQAQGARNQKSQQSQKSQSTSKSSSSADSPSSPGDGAPAPNESATH